MDPTTQTQTETAPEFGTKVGDAFPSFADELLAEVNKPDDKPENETTETTEKPAATEEKKETQSEQPADDAFKGASKAARENFEKVTARNRELEARLKELETKEPAVPEDLQKRLQELEQQNSEYSQQFERLSFEQHPKFRELTGQQQKLTTQLTKLVQVGGGNVEMLEKAFRLTGRAQSEAIEDAMADLMDRDKRRADSLLREIEDTQDKIETSREQYKELLPQWEQEEQQAHQRQIQELRKQQEQSFSSVLTDLAKDYPDLVGDEGKPLVEAARHLLQSDQPFNEYAKAALLAQQAPVLAKKLTEEREARAAAERQLKALEGAETRHSGAGDRTAETSANKSWAEEIQEMVHGG